MGTDPIHPKSVCWFPVSSPGSIPAITPASAATSGFFARYHSSTNVIAQPVQWSADTRCPSTLTRGQSPDNVAEPGKLRRRSSRWHIPEDAIRNVTSTTPCSPVQRHTHSSSRSSTPDTRYCKPRPAVPFLLVCLVSDSSISPNTNADVRRLPYEAYHRQLPTPTAIQHPNEDVRVPSPRSCCPVCENCEWHPDHPADGEAADESGAAKSYWCRRGGADAKQG